MKGYFIVSYEGLAKRKSGIAKKIHTQINAMNSFGLDCELYIQKSGRENIPSLIGKVLYILPFTNVNPKWEYNTLFDDIDFLYFRRPISMTRAMRKFLKECKKKNPKIKIYIEIPTFPYDTEYSGFVDKYLLIKDKFNRGKLRGLVDCFFIIDPMKLVDKLYGIDTVHFLNGYDVKNTPVRTYYEHESINLVCVGMFNFWHGYERLIEGLHLYYVNGGERDIHVDIVGDGCELPKYKQLTHTYNLDGRVKFHGKLFGEELDRIYKIADIGVSSLGRYKNNINIVGDLKTREYLAKGIPVISGCTVDLFENKTFDFYREIPNTPDPVDINVVLDFFDYIMNERKKRNIEEYMYTYSLNTFDITTTMKPVVERIMEDCMEKQ